MNESVRVESGDHGTIVVVAAWCAKCKQEAMPGREGECMFCGEQIVDLDTLSAKELRGQLPGPPAPVVPIREFVTVQPPSLRIADGFTLPVDVAGEATAILAKRGAGKTNTARVLTEEYVRIGVQIAVLDPIGVWWGARSSSDGEHDGLPLPILGGEHGDVGLDAWAGAAIADALVDARLSVILDLSDFSKDDQRTFVADFAEQLYARKARQQSLIHVMLEEADEFAPQRARAGGDPEEARRMRSAVEQLARRGRSRGIGITMVTQRSSALSKDVLTQADVLIAMRTTGPTDIRAINDWVHRNADAGEDVVRSLPTLQTGEGWVWNPERDLLARVHIRLAETFDSSSTPKFGEQRVTPRKAPVELPLAFADLLPPEPDIGADYRLQDADGRWGCKIDGCDGRAKSRSGPLAFLCDDHAGRGTSADEELERCSVRGCDGEADVDGLCQAHLEGKVAEIFRPDPRAGRLTDAQVEEIQARTDESSYALGDEYGVDAAYVRALRRGERRGSRTKGYRQIASGRFQVRVSPFPPETVATEEEAVARAAELRDRRFELRQSERQEARAPIVVDGEEIFGLTGHFARDAERVRGEAERLRRQAEALDRMADNFDDLAALQAEA